MGVIGFLIAGGYDSIQNYYHLHYSEVTPDEYVKDEYVFKDGGYAFFIHEGGCRCIINPPTNRGRILDFQKFKGYVLCDMCFDEYSRRMMFAISARNIVREEYDSTELSAFSFDDVYIIHDKDTNKKKYITLTMKQKDEYYDKTFYKLVNKE